MPLLLTLDLSLPPAERWRGLEPHVTVARSLVDSYVRDLGLKDATALGPWSSRLDDYRAAFVRADLAAEMDSIARLIDRPAQSVLIANLYYDLVRAVIGCTAFAIDGPEGPMHARNLDWWTDEVLLGGEGGADDAGRPFQLLADGTLIVRARGAPAGTFDTVGWPAFVGAFSGVAAGRFAITMNAVLSNDRAPGGTSIALLLREVFERCASFDAAVRVLRDTPLACDCLLLVSGVRAGELVLIERTPTRAALRGPEHGVLVVTNDFRSAALCQPSMLTDSRQTAIGADELSRTACSRLERARQLATETRPTNTAGYFAILEDPAVRMGITVQHMVMHAATGALDVRIPARTLR